MVRDPRVSDTTLSKTIASTATLKIANIHTLDLFYTPIEERFERITLEGVSFRYSPTAPLVI